MNEEDAQKTCALLKAGTELAGAAVSSALGFFAAGPAGAAAAGFVGAAITQGSVKLIGDIADRQLSAREQKRVGATAALIFDKVGSFFNNGNHPREKEFFESGDDGRSSAEEILEGTLRQAREEYEEKKLELLGRFYSNLVFSPGVTTTEANFYLRIFGQLTYRQLCVVCIVFMLPYYPPYQDLRDSNYRNNVNPMDAETVSLLQEVYDLNQKGIVACKNGENSYSMLLSWHCVNPKALELTGLGERLQKLFMGGSSAFKISELDLIAKKLR